MREALEAVASHEVGKVVLARDLVGTVPKGADLRRLARALAIGYPDCWTYAVDGIIGASPETLVTVSGGTVTARVLAGTAPRGADADADTAASLALATSAKDQDEHLYAVQSVLASLRPHTSALAASEQPFTLKLPNVFHLATDVEGDLSDGASSLDLVGALHPTAAVAGSPTAAAIEVIRRLEPFDRGRYAGPVGWVDGNGDGEWAIALRCAQFDVSEGSRGQRGDDPRHRSRGCGDRGRQRPGGRTAGDPCEVPPHRGRPRMTGTVGSLPPHGDAILTNLRLVDGIDPEPRDGVAVVIRNGVIRDIAPAGSVSSDAGAIDLGGAHVMPGLINMHTHLSLSLPGPGGDAVSALDEHELALTWRTAPAAPSCRESRPCAASRRRAGRTSPSAARFSPVGYRAPGSSPPVERSPAPAGTVTTPTTRSSATDPWNSPAACADSCGPERISSRS